MKKKESFELRKLQTGDEHAFSVAYREFKLARDFDFASPHYSEGMDFTQFLKILVEQEKGLKLPEGFVPSTFLFAFVGQRIIEQVMIRHWLNDFLRRIGGHIGYGVVPSERGKGYAAKMLKESLVIAGIMGLSQVLVTCDETNIASRKVIEGAGGVFEGFSDQGEEAPKKRLYWLQSEINRVSIIGASGSGKTTLGKHLASKWGLPLCDLDDLAWLPGWVERNRKEERADVEEMVSQKKWIIVGNYSRHQDITWSNANLIIWLDLPLRICLWRGLRRAVKNIYYQRALCNGNYDSWSRLLRLGNQSILYWILTTHAKKRVRYEKLLEREKNFALPIHYRLRSRSQVADFE